MMCAYMTVVLLPSAAPRCTRLCDRVGYLHSPHTLFPTREAWLHMTMPRALGVLPSAGRCVELWLLAQSAS